MLGPDMFLHFVLTTVPLEGQDALLTSWLITEPAYVKVLRLEVPVPVSFAVTADIAARPLAAIVTLNI